tara:strand:- start:4996 stop:5589 length:594 start_codon:yes stop_codon:yes gene_type:complete
MVLTGIAAILLGLIRYAGVNQGSYLWLNWNLFLAWIPFFLVYVVYKMRFPNWINGLLLLSWLFFLPNAPYLVTDFIHLDVVGAREDIWYDAIMIFMYTISGIVAWIGSVHMVKIRYSLSSWFVPVIALLSGYGVYLGRYIRFNSWDLVTQPIKVLETIIATLAMPKDFYPVITMTASIALMLIVAYYSFAEQNNHEH